MKFSNVEVKTTIRVVFANVLFSFYICFLLIYTYMGFKPAYDFFTTYFLNLFASHWDVDEIYYSPPLYTAKGHE